MEKRSISGGQILLYVILLILAVFCGFGVYFTVTGVLSPMRGTLPIGLLGLGLFLFGLGVVICMQASLLRNPQDSFWKTFGLYYSVGESSVYDLSAPKLRVEVRLECSDWKGLCTLMVVKEGLYFRKSDGGSIRMDYDKCSRFVIDKSRIQLTGQYAGSYQNTGDVVISSPTVLQSRAIYDTVQRFHTWSDMDEREEN